MEKDLEKLPITPKPFQEAFLYSDARYPAFVAGWATGKTMFAIARGLRLSVAIPKNVGLIVRKEYTDLRDSTIRDFEDYTGRKVGSDKNVRLENGSIIMFRHGKELGPNVLKNINLGWFLIEQGEEFDSDEQFQMLRGRLRRKVKVQSGMVIANVRGHNWIWRLWKINPPSNEYELYEATTFDNADNLPESYIKDLRAMEKESPNHFKRFVLNSWDELEEGDTVISFLDIIESQKCNIIQPFTKKIIAVDPAEFGEDETVIYALKNTEVIDQDIFGQKEPMENVGRIIAMKRKHEANLIVGDAIGIGSGIFSRLREMGEPTLGLKVSEKDTVSDPAKFFNLRAEIYWYAREQFEERIPKVFDDQLIAQLSAIKHERNSFGQIQIEKKEKIKERIGRSPDRADAYVMGLWGLKFATPKEKEVKKDAYLEKKPVGDYMSV